MFAFAVWDERRGRLVLGRDRLGKKPLYYWCSGGRLVFGSEIKAVLADPAVPRRLDPGAIPAYLTFGYVPTPRTFFEGVRSLPPGPRADLRARRRAGRRALLGAARRRASTARRESTARSPRRRARSAALLEAAVRRRLISDVPLGAFLSGGIDSTHDRRDHGRPARPAGADVHDRLRGPRRLRRAPVRAARGAAATPPTTTSSSSTPTPSTWSSGWSGTTTSRSATRAPIPTFLLSEMTRGARHGRAVGRRRRRAVRRLRALRGRARRTALRGPAGPRAAGRASRARPASRRQPRRPGGQPAAVRAGGASRASPTPIAPGSATSATPTATRCSTAGATTGRSRTTAASGPPPQGAHPLDRLLDLNLRTYLLDDLLVKADRTSMAHGLEVRSPLLDIDLLAYTARLHPAPEGARAVAQARAQGGGRRPAAHGDHRAGASGASASPSTAGSARTSSLRRLDARCARRPRPAPPRARRGRPDARRARHAAPATTATPSGRC